MKLSKKIFVLINGGIFCAFVLEHIISNSILPRLFPLNSTHESTLLLVFSINIGLWIIGIILWWKFIKKYHSYLSGNIFPYVILAVLAAILLADSILIHFHLVPLFPNCMVPQPETMTLKEIDEIMNHYSLTGECKGQYIEEAYSYSDEISFYIILLFISLVSFIRNMYKKKIHDMSKEELFQ